VIRRSRIRLLALATLILVATPSSYSADIGTAFSYQGQLKQGGAPANGNLDIEFRLFDAATLGNQVGNTVTLNGVAVSNGLFTVTLNSAGEFGPSAFNGEQRWLQITVDESTLTPRQALTAAPYAATALSTVGLDGHSLDAADGDPMDAVYVDNVGNLGVGTTSPTARLDVNGAARTTTLEITGGSPLQQPLFGWGWNDYGQTTVPSGTFVAVAAGLYHGLAIRTDGTLVGWGYNGYGEIDVPTGTFTAVAAGFYHSLAIRSDGTLAGWGDNTYSQINIPAGTFTAVAAGQYHSLGIRSDGTLVGWGCGVPYNYGQCNVPLGTFTAIAAGQYHSLGIRSDGTLDGWGCGAPYNFGQCIVPSVVTFTAVAAGGAHSVGIRSDGTLVGWGDNGSGQINVPAGTFTAVAAGSVHSLAIRSNGTLVGWGSNIYGQTTVPSGTFTTVAAGDSHSLAIASDPTPGNFGLLLATDSAVKPGSNTWTIYSDRRLKKNIEPLSGALDRLLQLRGVTFQWLDPASQGGITGTQMGLIADEVSRAFPQWVGRDPKGYQTLTVGGFEALTAEALRELRAEKDRQLYDKDCEITELQDQEAAKDKRINKLEARLAAIEAMIARSPNVNNGGAR
jgi:hypothetical protein